MNDSLWFGWVLWYINHCRLFKAKSSIPMLNMICKHILLITFLNEAELICKQLNHLLAHVSFEVFSFLNELQVICLRISIVIVSIQLNGLNYC